MIGMNSLPFPRYNPGSRTIKDYTLPDDLVVEQWIVPKDTEVKLTIGPDFSYLMLEKGTFDKRGFVIPHTVFKY